MNTTTSPEVTALLYFVLWSFFPGNFFRNVLFNTIDEAVV